MSVGDLGRVEFCNGIVDVMFEYLLKFEESKFGEYGGLKIEGFLVVMILYWL